jgi:HD-like signal output (HDOD) protein
VTHAEVGAHLLGIWGLPFETMEAVCHHHALSRVTGGRLDLLAVVHVADVLADATCRPGSDAREELLDRPFLERSGAIAKLPAWRELALAAAREAA